MKKQMTLGKKITLGFVGLIVIAVALGSLAVWNMSTAGSQATLMATESVPAVGAANEVERTALAVMYEIRGYGFTEEQAFLDAGLKNLEDLKKSLTAARELAAKATTLTTLAENEKKASEQVAKYEKLVSDTQKIIEKMKAALGQMDVAAKGYMEASYGYLTIANKDLNEELAGNAEKVTLIDRINKVNLINDVVDLGNAVRIGNFRAQATRSPETFREAQGKFVDVDKKLAELRAITKQESDLKRIEQVEANAKAYNVAMTAFLTQWLANQDVAAQRTATGNLVLDAAKETSKAGMVDVTKMTANSATSLGTANITLITGLILAVGIGVSLSFFITRSISKALNRMAGTLGDGSAQVAAASGQLSASSQSIAQGASEQAAALEETTSALEEMSSMTRKNAETAQQAAALAAEAQRAATEGNGAMTKMSSAITEIQKSATETGKIIKVIDEIAFQTNLLALNAAVEAARAGEAGKGFAVVAEEVRNLAMRSAEAAKNTAAMIEESVTNSRNGVAIVGEVGKTLGEITATATKVNGLISEIAAASQEQSQGIGQVNTAVSQMDKVTQSNAANAEESASASEELSSQAEALRSVVQELVALVGGRNDEEARPVRRSGNGGSGMSRGNGSGGKLKLAGKGGKASQMIPLDDDDRGMRGGSHGSTGADFAEFGKAA